MTPEGFKNRGRPRSSIPLEQRKRIYGARARAKRQAWLASHPAEAARVRKKSRESQREWRWKNIRRFRVNARRRYRLVCAQNPAHVYTSFQPMNTPPIHALEIMSAKKVWSKPALVLVSVSLKTLAGGGDGADGLAGSSS